MRCGIIYMATSRTTGKSYIGRDINCTERKIEHKRDAFNKHHNAYNTHFHCAIRKYGFNDFDWKILYSDVQEEMLNLAEICAIYVYDTYYSGYNSTMGGEGSFGYTHSLETITKMSKPRSLEARKNISISHLGKSPSQKTRNKMSRQRLGKKHSSLHKERIALSLSKKRYKILKPNGEIEIIRNLTKYCLDNGLDPSHMNSVLKGKRIQHKGYRCEYYEKEEYN